MSDTATTPGSTVTSPTAPHVPRAVGVALAAAVIGNLLVWGVARLLGADFYVVRPDGEAFTLGAGPVSVLTVASVLVGGLVLLAAARGSGRAWPALAWLGLTVGVLTVWMPFTVEADLDTKLALAVMHVVAGVAWFGALRREA